MIPSNGKYCKDPKLKSETMSLATYVLSIFYQP